MSDRYTKILLQRGQTDLVSVPFYVNEKKVSISAYSGGVGLPPGARITFQEVVFVDGGRKDGTLCSPGQMNPSNQFDYKPFTSCGCTPALYSGLSYIEISRPGWYRAVYAGPSRASVLLTALETNIAVGDGCAEACCPIDVNLKAVKYLEPSDVGATGCITATQQGVFIIEVSNSGPSASSGGSVVDTLPEGVSWVHQKQHSLVVQQVHSLH